MSTISRQIAIRAVWNSEQQERYPAKMERTLCGVFNDTNNNITGGVGWISLRVKSCKPMWNCTIIDLVSRTDSGVVWGGSRFAWKLANLCGTVQL